MQVWWPCGLEASERKSRCCKPHFNQRWRGLWGILQVNRSLKRPRLVTIIQFLLLFTKVYLIHENYRISEWINDYAIKNNKLSL